MKLYDKMNELGHDMFSIELVEQYPCSSRIELHRREGDIIRELKPTLNSFVAGRTQKEYYQENKDKEFARHYAYYLKNKEKIDEWQKQYNKAYRQANQEKMREIRQDNQEQNAQTSREYYLKNKDKILMKKTERHLCSMCGVSYSYANKSVHMRSKKHLAVVSNHNDE
jgi:hypothetical protein